MSLIVPKTFHVVGGDDLIEDMFEARGWSKVAVPAAETLVVFSGGEDVSPDLYSELRHPTTRNSYNRDKNELWDFHCYMGHQKVGICRGGQFLNVASGGRMWQNVDCHAINGVHDLIDLDTDEIIKVTSTHHQMMRPSDEAMWIATAKEAKKLETYDEVVIVDHEYAEDVETMDYASAEAWDCEVIFYDRTQSLCFQPHPEYGVKPCEEYFFRCLQKVFG